MMRDKGGGGGYARKMFSSRTSAAISTESNLNISQAKAWTAIKRLSIIWKFDLSSKIKRDILQAVPMSIPQYGGTTWTLTKRMGEKQDRNYRGKLRSILNKFWKNSSRNSCCTAT